DYARSHRLNVVPEIQSLTHTYYLVLAHREIAEIPEADWPDSYDPSNPKSYDLLFDVIDEYLEVIRPEWVHIGHDEWRAGVKGNTGELFAHDVLAIHGYLESRGVKTMMWADHLVAGHNMKSRIPEVPAEGVWYAYPSTEGAAEIIANQTKDILMLNWSWGVDPTSDQQLTGKGWPMIFGNFSGESQYDTWHDRLAKPGVLGAEMSTWCLANELSYGQNGSLLNMLLSQSLLWSDKVPPRGEVFEYLAAATPEIRELLSGHRLPSQDVLRKRPGYSFVTLDISAAGNTGRKADGLNLNGVAGGPINYAGLPFAIGAGERAFVSAGPGETSRSIAVGTNAASLLFLHLSSAEAERASTYNSNYPEDTAEPLGYYRVRYADGLEETVPIRYGRNIMQLSNDFGDQIYFA
ncbi:MAG TPA: family 20 glycosylhydrolase, partial [Candidatus Glassbacteria bacterium]|nr:family 20 glycosylhydrolase [Candidatus Glassbacteria bacterium]